VNRNLSQALRFLSLGASPLVFRETLEPSDLLSFLLTEDNLVLLTEDGRNLGLESLSFLLTENSLVLLTEDGRKLELG